MSPVTSFEKISSVITGLAASNMNNDNEHIHVEFHNKARTIFFSLLRDFESSVENLNRRKQEYQFQELKNKYINTLKHQLESCATVLFEKHCNLKKSNELNQNLQSFIKDYLHLFVQKTRSA